MMSTCTSASRELISQGPAAQPRLENAAVYDLVPLGILSGVMCLEQLLPSLSIQPHSSSEETDCLVIAQTRRPTLVHAALPARLVFSIFALQKPCPSFKIQFKY